MQRSLVNFQPRGAEVSSDNWEVAYMLYGALESWACHTRTAPPGLKECRSGKEKFRIKSHLQNTLKRTITPTTYYRPHQRTIKSYLLQARACCTFVICCFKSSSSLQQNGFWLAACQYFYRSSSAGKNRSESDYNDIVHHYICDVGHYIV